VAQAFLPVLILQNIKDTGKHTCATSASAH